MQFTTADIHAAEDFAKGLLRACSQILEGKPVSQAIDDEGIGASAFKTVLKSIKKSNGINASELAEYRHPAWQDDLVSDICGSGEAYIPKDFEGTLSAVEEQVLDEDGRRIIDYYYKGHLSLSEVASRLGINESNAAIKKNAAIKALRSRKRDLVMGREYLSTLEELKGLYDRRQAELGWMRDAVSFLKKMNADAVVEVSDEERSFFKEEGMLKLSEVIGVSPSELLSRVVKSAYGYVESLRVPDDERLVYPDTLLSELDLPKKSVIAFERAGYETVGEVLSLSEAQACDIPGVSARLLLHICWMILGEENGR